MEKIVLTEEQLHQLVENAVQNTLNNMGIGQQQMNSQQQPQQTAQLSAFEQSLVKFLNQFSGFVKEQLLMANKKIDTISQQNQFLARQLQQVRSGAPTRMY